MKTLFSKSPPAIPIRGVHLDLKGTPPTFERLLSLLDLFSALRLNLVLVEWEDAFPWSVDPDFCSETAYTDDEVRQFVAKADRLGLELVPLVQTLGHMENFLRSERYASLREKDAEDVINPLAEGASEFVQSLLKDVLRLMPSVRRFHLGGDEARSLGQHLQTASYIKEHGAASLYLHHMHPLFHFLKAQGMRPLLWHDMMSAWDEEALKDIAHQCDLVVWGYGEHPDQTPHHFHSRYIARFAKAGISLWGATAFKGADGLDRDRPDLKNRLENGRAWMEIAERFSFSGLITTGWSRYNTNACQCESVEASLDSLLAHAVLMHEGSVSDSIAPDAPELLKNLRGPEEGLRFAKVRIAADAYDQAHHDMRREVGNLWLGTRRKDRARGPNKNYIRYYKKCLGELEKTGDAYRKTLETLIPDVWLDAYFVDRLEGFRDFLKIAEAEK